MSFVFPQFLWALGLVAIPIVIHLFNFRKYTNIYFSNVKFLKEVKEETKRRSTLKHLLILAMRILAIVCLVLAFAQPYFPGKLNSTNTEKQVVSVYVDNSFSMDSEGSDGRFLDMAKQMAIEIANKYDESTQFNLLSNELNGNQLRLLNKQNFIDACTEIELSPQTRTVNEVLKRQSEIFKKDPKRAFQAYMISDFQTNMFENTIVEDSLPELRAIFLKANERNNLFIDSCWFETPLRKVKEIEVLKVRVGNYSDSSKSVKLSLNTNGTVYDSKITIPADTTAITEIKYTNKVAGNVDAEVYLSAARQMKFDDTLFFSYQVLKQINVLEINNETDNTFNNIFGNDPLMNFNSATVGTLDLSDINRNQLVILNGLNSLSGGLASQLSDYVTNGGSLAIFPGPELNISSYGQFLSSIGANSYVSAQNTSSMAVKSYNRDHVFFQNLFEKENPGVSLPKTSRYYQIGGTYSSKEVVLMDFYSNSPALSLYPIGAGKVYLSAIPLDAGLSTLKRNWILVTSVLRMAELSYPKRPLSYTIGGRQYPTLIDKGFNKEVNFEISNKTTSIIPISDRSKAGSIALIDALGGNGNSIIKDDGIYELKYDGETIDKLAYNFNRRESIMTFVKDVTTLEEKLISKGIKTLYVQEATEIKDLISSIENEKNKEYWIHCLVAALIFLGLEILIIRLWKQ